MSSSGEEKMKKQRVVLASGVFDLLHLGHVKFLEEAKRAGGEGSKLIVVVARDSTVQRMKGAKPIITEENRRALVEALKVVDEAILGFEEMDIGKVLESVKPDVVAVGYDQDGIEAEVKRVIAEKALPVEVVKIGKFLSEDIDSSTNIKRKIAENYGKVVGHKK